MGMRVSYFRGKNFFFFYYYGVARQDSARPPLEITRLRFGGIYRLWDRFGLNGGYLPCPPRLS